MSSASDGELLSRVAARDAHALEQLYDSYAPYVMGVAHQILRTRQDAEEVVQEVFWKLWSRGLRYDSSRGRFSTWLFAVARNQALDHRRAQLSRRAPATEASPVLAQTAEDPETLAFLRESRRTVTAALAELSEAERSAIELAFYRGFSHSEIADRTGEPLGTIKSRIRRATEKLRASLAAHEGSV